MKKQLLILTTAALITQGLYAETTTCYKKNWPLPSTIELTKLEGGLCAGKNSFRNMSQKGWYIKDIIIKPNEAGLDYEYILTKDNPVAITKEELQKAADTEIAEAKAEEVSEKQVTATKTEVATQEKEVKTTKTQTTQKSETVTPAKVEEVEKKEVVVKKVEAKKSIPIITKRIVKKEVLPLYTQITKIQNVTNETATIKIGNLKVGQSGLVRHYYENGKSMIISDAYVVSSNKESSQIKFIPFLGLKQNAIPTTSRVPAENDELVLNYLYDSSLLITPDATSFRATRLKFTKQNFQHSDMFGTFLKIEGNPFPSKELIQSFATQEDLGTIFIVISNKIYILDTKTFVILDVRNLNYLANKEMMPFYTRVENIEQNLFTRDWTSWFSFSWLTDFFGDDSGKTDDEIIFDEEAKSKLLSTSYTAYYKKILGVDIDK